MRLARIHDPTTNDGLQDLDAANLFRRNGGDIAFQQRQVGEHAFCDSAFLVFLIFGERSVDCVGAKRLLDLRAELRDLTIKTTELCRRVNSLVGLHRRVMRDVIDTLLTDEGPSPMKDTGTLLNAEA